MASHRSAKFWRNSARRHADVGMKVYWVLVTIMSVAMLSATISLATPPDAADLAAARIIAN